MDGRVISGPPATEDESERPGSYAGFAAVVPGIIGVMVFGLLWHAYSQAAAEYQSAAAQFLGNPAQCAHDITMHQVGMIGAVVSVVVIIVAGGCELRGSESRCRSDGCAEPGAAA